MTSAKTETRGFRTCCCCCRGGWSPAAVDEVGADGVVEGGVVEGSVVVEGVAVGLAPSLAPLLLSGGEFDGGP